MRLPFGLGFVGGFVSRGVFLGSLAAAFLTSSAGLFTLGLAAYIVLEVLFFRVGRLEPDTRDPITAMQVRRYARGGAAPEH